MKKNISINIGGIIFHIDEDGFERLKEYLDSINRYFSTFEDSSEIIADIESRIAEIFLSKLNESKQVITMEDVSALITTMGSIQDFQAVEDSEIYAESKTDSKERKEESEGESEHHPKKLYRDGKRKLLGGVAAGIAHYFSIDPLWIRLIFIVLVFDIFLTFSVSGILIISYIIMWIVLPESIDLKEDKKVRKLYRNPDDRVLGGVASGIAAYFAADVVVIRLLFVLTIFLGGAGILAYLILWMILPEAKTITDKVQMKGEPVTLSNIESNIKSNLNIKEGEEHIVVKILLFPFRLLAMLLTAIGKALGPIASFLVDAIRIIAGLVFSLTGVALLVALLIVLGVLIGLFTGNPNIETFPIELLKETFPTYALVAAFIATGIPVLGLILGGIAIIIKNRSVHPSIGWTMFAIWIISIVVLAIATPAIVTQFRSEGTYTMETLYDFGDKTAVLDQNNLGLEEYHATTLRLRGYEGGQFKLVQEFESRGRSRQDAIENAQMIEYHVNRKDSVLTFDSNIMFRENAQFRGQRLRMTLYIPYNTPFVISDTMDFIRYNTIYRYDYRISDMDRDNRWIFTEDGELKCVTCEDFTRD